MSLTIQNTAAMEAVNALAPVQPLAKRMEQEHNKAMNAAGGGRDPVEKPVSATAADGPATPASAADGGGSEPVHDLPASDSDTAVPVQDEDAPRDRVEDTHPDESSDRADAFIERIVGAPRTDEAMLASRLNTVAVPTAPTPAATSQAAAAHPGAALPATDGTVPTGVEAGNRPDRPPQPASGQGFGTVTSAGQATREALAPSATTPSPAALPTPATAVTRPLPPEASTPGAAQKDASQPAVALPVRSATSEGLVASGRRAAQSVLAPVDAGADASRGPEAGVATPRAPAPGTSGAAGRHDSDAAPVPALNVQDAATRHSAEAAAGDAGQARSEANIASQRNLQHVQQAQKTAEVLAKRASAGARMDVVFTSWGPGNSVSMSRQLGGDWTATPSNARVGQALGSSITPDDLQVRLAGESFRVEEGSTADPDGRRRQQHEHDTP